jgi:hypothetical protein
MAKGDRKHVALGAQGKRSGAGAMSDLARERVEENAIRRKRAGSRLFESLVDELGDYDPCNPDR